MISKQCRTCFVDVGQRGLESHEVGTTVNLQKKITSSLSQSKWFPRDRTSEGLGRQSLSRLWEGAAPSTWDDKSYDES
jgi:hypothetical protein